MIISCLFLDGNRLVAEGSGQTALLPVITRSAKRFVSNLYRTRNATLYYRDCRVTRSALLAMTP
ncbi:MAG: hypothetical protein LBL66_06965 [Clostridiales bacterium]|nr:hypothetical protein [Clostridiales bacterium]